MRCWKWLILVYSFHKAFCHHAVLYIGVTFASFQSSGNIPVSSDRLNIYASDSNIVSSACFTSWVEILSRPVDFPISKFLIYLFISWMNIFSKEKVFVEWFMYDGGCGLVSLSMILLARLGPIDVQNLSYSSTMSFLSVILFPWPILSSLTVVALNCLFKRLFNWQFVADYQIFSLTIYILVVCWSYF